MKKLTPTSYVLLGLLARRPWSAYELNNHMQNSILTAYWPRAESHVYSEPKKLVEHDLATAEKEDNNGRLRTVYTITDQGQEALQQWLQTPTNNYAAIYYETMLKFLCADAGSVEAMRKNVREVKEGAREEARVIAAGILQARSAIPEDIRGMPFNSMGINFLLDVVEVRIRWANEMEAALADFEDTSAGPKARRTGAKYYLKAQARLDEILKGD